MSAFINKDRLKIDEDEDNLKLRSGQVEFLSGQLTPPATDHGGLLFGSLGPPGVGPVTGKKKLG